MLSSNTHENTLDQPHAVKTPDKTFMQKLITQWEQSNQTQKAFCHAMGISFNMFAYWRGKLLAENKLKAKPAAFIPLHIKPEKIAPTPQSMVIVEKPNGDKVSLPCYLPEKQMELLFRLLGITHD